MRESNTTLILYNMNGRNHVISKSTKRNQLLVQILFDPMSALSSYKSTPPDVNIHCHPGKNKNETHRGRSASPLQTVYSHD